MARPRSTGSPGQTGDTVRWSTLDSGVRVVTESMPGVRSVAVGMWLNVGSRDERGPVAGASHLLEHLLFKGTRRRSAQEIAEAIDAVGGDMNAFTSKEYTCFYARCLDRDLALAVDVLGDMVTAARNRRADVDAEREVVLEEIRMHLDTPDDLVHSVFAEAYFDGHPLGREVLGSDETVAAIDRDQVHRYYQRHYVPENLVVAAAGNLEHDRVVRLVDDALAGWDADGGSRIRRRPPRRPGRPRAAVRARPTEQTHLVLGGTGLTRSDERRHAGAVLNQALGGGMASRLFQEVRERRGLVYTVFSHQGMQSDAGTFGVYAGTAPRKVGEVLEVVRGELAKALESGLTDAELDRAKGSLAGSLVLALEDTGSRMIRVGKSAVTGAPLLTLDETIAAVGAVTHDDVADVAGLLLRGPFTLAVVGPYDGDRPDFGRYLAAA